MNPPAPTPVPIHDIMGPWQIVDFPLPMVTGGVAALLLLGLLAIWFFRGRRHHRILTPKERALAVLADLRARGGSAYDCGVKVSDALRTYMNEQHGLDAVHRTSLEFLESLRGNPVFDDNEKSSLAAFLEASDLIKYARADAGRDELGQLFDTAERLVNAGKPEVRK